MDSNKNAPRKITTTWDHRYRLPLLKQVYAPGTDADLTTCEPDNDNGWIKRFEVTRQYEPDSGRLAQISKQSFGVTGLADELPRITTFRYYAEGEQGGMQYQLKEIDGPRSDVIDVQRFRYAIDHSSDHNPGDLIEIENALGHLTKFTRHDAFGRVVESLDPNGVLSSTEYHPRGWMKTRSIGDYQLAFEYDEAGQLIKVIQSGGDVIEYRYDSAHRLTDITDGFGNYIHYELDPAGNRVSEKIFDSHGTLRKHLERIINSANRIEKAISFVDLEHQNARGFIYDGNGDLLEDIDPRDPAINADGPLPSEPTIYSSRTYDALRRPIEIRNKEGGLTTIAYDVFDNITHVTEPSDGNVSTPQGLSTHYKYNSFGELKQLDSPDSGITKFSYDGAGNLITRETAGLRTQGEKINYYYDALNRLRLVDYPTNQQDISYEYDRADEQQYGIGRLHQIIDESGTTSLTHDRHGNIVEISFLRDGLLTSIKYSFSGAKQLASITTPSGKEIRRTFQVPLEGATSNLISSIELYDQHSAQVLIDDVHYAPFGPLESWEYHNGLSARRRFDLDYQVSGISHGNFLWRDYLLDAAANITQITDMLSGNVETFSYDGLERLITANAAQLSTTYHYDAIGNRREVVTDLLTQNYFYAPETHHLIKTDGIASREFEFDLDGNVITSGDLRFHYANDGRPKVVRTGQDVIASFKHNALGQRTEKDIGYKIFYYYDLAGRLLEEGDQFGNAHKTYVYLEDTLVAMLEEEINPFEDSDEDGMRNGYETNFGFSAFDPSDANLDADNDSYSNLSEHDAGTDPRDPNDSPAADTHLVKQIPAIGTVTALLAALAVLALLLPQINSAPLVVSLVLVLSWFVAQTANAEIHYVHTDHLGTPIMMTDEHQVITWQARYTPFGLAVVDSGSTTELNLRFPGQYFDQETGFHYNYFRDYDPSTGRYLQSDPIGLHGGINTFVYALGNPLKYLDRFGLWVMRCARKLGSPDSAPVAPSGNPLRHDYLSVSGSILSFQAGTGNGWRDMFKSQGWIDTRNERPTNSKCKMVCEDDDFDQFVFEASSEIGAPTYCIIPGMPGAENCQTWASDVLKLAKKNYLESVPCPKCFVKDNSRFLQNFRDDFGRAL